MRDLHRPGAGAGTLQHAGTDGLASPASPGKATLVEQLQATLPVQPRPATQISFTGAPMSAGVRDTGGLGPVSEDADLGGAATKSGTTDTEAATWKDHGAFRWAVGWTTDGTTGWIVQKVTSTYTGTRKDGSAITLASVGTTPSYYEAWAVDGAGKVSPAAGATNDIWSRGSKGDGSKGTWSMKGDVHWTSSDPAKSGLTPGGVANAGILLSGTSAPAGLSGVLQTRHADGAWDSTTKPATHAGKAG